MVGILVLTAPGTGGVKPNIGTFGAEPWGVPPPFSLFPFFLFFFLGGGGGVQGLS